MELIRIETPRPFTAIREIRADSCYRTDGVCLQYCAECGQVFSAVFGYVPGCGWSRWRGDMFFCPDCGKLHSRNYLSATRYKGQKSQWLPFNLTITLKEFKSHFSLRVTANCVKFTADGEDVEYKIIRESLIFDVKQQKVVFKSSNGVAELELGNPYSATPFLNTSLLRYIIPESTVWQAQKKEANLLLKYLRDGITKKMKAIHGIDLKAMSIPAGKRYGLFLLPIVNIAWRMACPDAGNLPLYEIVEGSYPSYKELLEIHRLRCGAPPARAIDFLIALTRKGLSYPQAVAKAYKLPDTKSIVKMLAASDIFDAGRIKTGFNLMKDYKYRIFSARFLLQEINLFSLSANDEPSEIIRFIKEVASIRGDKLATKLLSNYVKLQTRDIAAMYYKLNAQNKERFWAKKLTAERMHEWLVDAWEAQAYPNYDLAVPEAIVRRLEMQKETIKFFVPDTAYRLKAAGKELHNCVGSYANSVLDGECCIVLVADDLGKLKVCLEIDQQNNLRQAKLTCNKPVSTDKVLNAEVLKWSKEAKLTIATLDVKVEENTNLEAAV